MFTGLIEEVGTIRTMTQAGLAMQLTIACDKVLQGTALGDSIAVNGICLTVTHLGSDHFTADVMPETIKRTNLSRLTHGASVNLERAIAAGQRMGGHFVQGHVDGIGKLTERRPYENAILFRFQVPADLAQYMIEKGSIAVNGISLTIVETGADFFTVSVIPHTLAQTQLQKAVTGDWVNIECDMIGKYIAKFINKGTSSSLTMEKLVEAGFIG